MLKPHECLLVSRLRAQEGLTQDEYARHYYKVSAYTYRIHENGRKPIPASWRIPEVGELSDVERYIILRRRQFKTRLDMVAAMRESTRPDFSEQTRKFFTTINVRRIQEEEREQIPPTALAAWWGSQEV